MRQRMERAAAFAWLYDEHRPSPCEGDPMHLSAELIGGVVTLVGLGILAFASVRSIGRRGSSAEG
ncbi:hypothetical protein STPH1_1676 [Streptomyces sp. OM5714]|nr:hypothetical protein STPH1_1676 [Streptomyces sp. OM5714]